MSRYDVLIIGAGPAGSATAAALAQRGVRVALIERSASGNGRARATARPVGETIWPQARLVLGQLGAWERFLAGGHRPCRAVFSAWGSDELGVTDFLFNPYGSGWTLDRRRFDATLVEAAEQAGATVLRGAIPSEVIRRDDGWRLALSKRPALSGAVHDERDHDAVEEISAAFLVDASGRSRWAARRLGARWIADDRLIALAGVMPPADSGSGEAAFAPDVLILEAACDGWWYSVSLPDGSLVAVWMMDRDEFDGAVLDGECLWRHNLELTHHTRARVEGFGPPDRVFTRPVDSGRLDPAAGMGWAAVGDCAWALDPLTGSGISRSMQSGLSAAEAIVECGACPDTVPHGYAEQTATAYERYCIERAAYYRMERRWPEAPFWNRRQLGTVQEESSPPSVDDRLEEELVAEGQDS